MAKHESKSYNEQQNRSSFKEESETVHAEKAGERPANLNKIPKNIDTPQ